MNALLSPGAPAPFGPAGFALDVVAKATLLLLVAYALHFAVRKRSVLACSVVWNACLLGLLALPAADWAFPRLRLDWLPAQALARSGAADRTPVAAASEPIIEVREPVAAAVVAEKIEPAAAALPTAASSTALPRAVPTVPASNARGPLETALSLVLGLYRLVALLMLARLALSLLAVARLVRSSRAVQQLAWTAALDVWRGQLKLKAPVRLLASDRVDVPIVLGCLRPTIVLPAGLAARLSSSQIDAVLLHELAHVRRGDYGWNLLRRVVQAAYWPHPLAWPLGRILGSLREQACDDLCVHWMGDRQGYRATLLDVAAQLVRPADVALGMAMARTTKLGARLARIEHSAGSARCRLAAPARIVVAVVVLGVAGLLGSVELTRGRVHAAQAQEPRKPEPSAQPKQPEPGAQPKRPEPGARPKSGPANDDTPKPIDEPPAQGKPAGDGEPAPGKREVIHVKTVKPKRGPFVVTTTHQGTIKSYAPRPITARVSGVIKSRQVQLGDKVKAGQVLAEIDAPDLAVDTRIKALMLNQARAQVRQAEAALQVARAALESASATHDQAEAELKAAEGKARFQLREKDRMAELFKQKAIDERVLDEKTDQLAAAEAARDSAKARVAVVMAGTSQDKAELAGAEAALETARDKLEIAAIEEAVTKERQRATQVTTPIDGLIVQLSAQVGDVVTPSAPEPLFVVANSSRLTAVVDAPEPVAMMIDVGDQASVTVNALHKTYESKVTRTAWALDAKTRMLPVEIDLPNPDGKLRPGFHVNATISVEQIPNALTLPADSVVMTTGAPGTAMNGYVLCVVNGRLVRKDIKLGSLGQGGFECEVLGGLNGDEDVVPYFRSDERTGVRQHMQATSASGPVIIYGLQNVDYVAEPEPPGTEKK